MITQEGRALGHAYDGTAVNAPCRRCEADIFAETGRFVTVLTCAWDDEE